MLEKFKTPIYTGLHEDKEDKRDLLYKEVLSAGELNDIDWERGYHASEVLGISMEQNDQGTSSSCVMQATSNLYRRWYYALSGKDVNFSARFGYAQIFLPEGGAYLRDGMKLASDKGLALEKFISSYENGKPPSEQYMRFKDDITASVFADAKKYDAFHYRVIEGKTSDINIFAHAIHTSYGVLGGFRGSNEGWRQNKIRPPKAHESMWGHAVDLIGYGIYEGEKCLFTPNSWAGRYTIREGRWKGCQAIPESYFTAGIKTADGVVQGVHVYNSWTFYKDKDLEEPQKHADFLKRNEGKIIQEAQKSGTFGLIKDGKVLVVPANRVAELVATYILRKEGIPVSLEMWKELPRGKF